MSHDLKFGRFCDECGRTERAIKRVYKGKDYCSTCYPKVFLKTNCHACSASTRAHRFEIHPICHACNIATRTCLRCGKSVPRAGYQIGERVACPACVPYFREKKPCSKCGVLSGQLSRYPLFGFLEPVCNRCRSAVAMRTCARCRKSRPVAFQTLEKKSFCASCIPGAEVFHSCPICHANAVGGGHSACERCYIREVVQRTAQITSTGLQSPWARELFINYSEWLLERTPEKPALPRLLQKHSPFFERLDVSFENTNLLTKQALLETMGTAYLRKFLLASKFVMNQLEGEVNTTEVIITSESATIQNKLIELAKKPYGLLLRNYVEWLEEHQTAIRTIRLYLRAAEKFCSDQNITSAIAPTQIQVNSFAKAHKGSINSLLRFISFGKSRLMWTIASPKNLPLKRLPLTVKRISALKEMIKSKGIESVGVEVLTKLMAILLGFKSSEVTLEKIKLDSQGVQIIEIQGELIYPPQSLNVYMYELIKRGKAFAAAGKQASAI